MYTVSNSARSELVPRGNGSATELYVPRRGLQVVTAAVGHLVLNVLNIPENHGVIIEPNHLWLASNNGAQTVENAGLSFGTALRDARYIVLPHSNGVRIGRNNPDEWLNEPLQRIIDASPTVSRGTHLGIDVESGVDGVLSFRNGSRTRGVELGAVFEGGSVEQWILPPLPAGSDLES